ncbi:MAG: ATP-dependent metallopeptidase FtsH/Yme1/Tma family protein [Candidatus Cloacimonetes bacterium]|nr:ATP-dependent metallopeptidase FtsH/Yme1/Tma family protein [Candidatus Cloacimonadota bacterium]
MQDRDNDPGKRPSRVARVTRGASFWILIFLVPLLVLQVFNPNRQQQSAELDYRPQFLSQLEAGNIESVTVVGSNRIEGTLRTPIIVDDRQVQAFTTTLPFENSTDELQAQLIAQDVTIRAEDPKQNWWFILLQALPWLLIIGFWFFMLRQMQAGGSKAFQFGKSKARLLSGDTPKVTFADVAGADEAKEELQEIIEFLKDPQKFSRLGGRLPKGVLLVGPPGTGKTLLARAVAGEAGRPFFSMSGSDFVEMFVGVGASRVRDLFEQGKAHAPCIIFIDEIDAVGRHRGAGLGGGHDEREQTLNQLLVEMDGFESNEGVILLAATNRPDVLDPALLRPGRFDRQVVVDAPDVKGREGILRVHLRRVPIADDVEVKALARATPGMSGADLQNLVNEGALLAARRGHDKVYMQDLEDAKDKVMLGAERRSMVLSESERKLTAYHEAGHAVVALRTPGLDPVHKITIVPRGRALGVTASLPEEDRHSYSRDYLIASLAMLYGGRAAEEMIFGKAKITTGAGNDIERATAMARRMVTQFGMSENIGPIAIGDSEHEVFLGREIGQRRAISENVAQQVDAEVKRLLDEAYQAAMTTLEENRDLLERIAEALLERETLDRDEIDLLARGEPLPEAKIVRDARLFAQSLRKEKEKESAPQPSGGFLGPQPQPGPAHG